MTTPQKKRYLTISHPAVGLFGIVLTLMFLTPSARGDDEADTLTSRANVVLMTRCVTCHGPEKAEGNLRLDSRESLLKGGDRGSVVSTENVTASLLLRSINGSDPDLQMPPKQPLSKSEIALIENWIRAGVPWPQSPNSPTVSSVERIGPAWTDPRNPIVKLFGGQRLGLWSLRSVERPDPPKFATSPWPRNEIDQFVLRNFFRAKRTPNKKADQHTLIRRITFDLTGLPPLSTDATRFEASTKETDIELLVDQLLASPRFGEHWARMWLDLVRYSDSNGFDWDEYRPHAFRFRDYVIRSLNEDKPFDQFIREQLAGDEITSGSPRTRAEQDQLIATGFLRLGPHDNAAGLFNEQDRSRHEWMTDLVETTGSVFLGLTFSCCRCHDHKYDPLSQADYYRMRAFFSAVKFADEVGLDLASETAAIDAHNKKVDGRIAELERKRDAIDARGRKRLKKDDAVQSEIEKALTDSERKERSQLQSRIDSAAGEKRHFTQALLVTDGEVQPTHVLYQGDHKSPRDVVQAGVPSIFDPQPLNIPQPPRNSTHGYRLALAQWIASPKNPLTSRVFVNRVWQNLMGCGIVRTPGDFGLAGLPPDDPELLDWLASSFVERNWSLKELIRQIVLSATYQQSASFESADGVPEELSYAIRQPRRLTAEQLRDAMLVVSGLLTNKSAGPAIWPDLPREVLEANPAFLDDNQSKTKGWYPSPESEQTCRSIFLIQKRNTRVPILESFDQPDNSVPCTRRLNSIVAPQAICMLNGDLSVKAARAFATRIEQRVGIDPNAEKKITVAFELALQRSPSADEVVACQILLESRNLSELCRVLLNLTEFAYID